MLCKTKDLFPKMMMPFLLSFDSQKDDSSQLKTGSLGRGFIF